MLLASAVLACGVGVLWLARRPGATRARLEQVKPGMSRDEVIEIVGGPPGNYSSRRRAPFTGIKYVLHESWVFEDGLLLVRFDDAGNAIDAVVLDILYGRPPTLTERIRRWLGL
jgi:hypothetical protein